MTRTRSPHSCTCGARWGGYHTAHCPACHLTFTCVSTFDRHRRRGGCLDPHDIPEFLPKHRNGYTVWGGHDERLHES